MNLRKNSTEGGNCTHLFVSVPALTVLTLVPTIMWPVGSYFPPLSICFLMVNEVCIPPLYRVIRTELSRQSSDYSNHHSGQQAATIKDQLSKAAQSCLTLCNPMAVACQDPLSMGFSRQEYWSGLPFPSPGDLPDPGIESGSPAL